jgi:hypothetical protein
MKTLFAIFGSVALWGLLMSQARAADAQRPDSDGYIRDWVTLAPIALPEGLPGADLVLEDQTKNEAALKPKAGDKIKIKGKELTWKNITASTNYFDFNAILKTVNEQNSWQGATRFLDKAGAPVKDLKIKLSP